jgi:hypothetical protein
VGKFEQMWVNLSKLGQIWTHIGKFGTILICGQIWQNVVIL